MTSSTKSLRRLLNLRQDQASPEAIDSAIRDGVQVGGTNLWVLMFAILIASVGLNVNSTAVIIGAMLISPLMGPIIGAGYGAGIQDTRLIRQSLRSLAVFAGISLATSALYFMLSPLTNAQSELLARTSPTIWDVLIAFFGGAAGMIGLTRREKTTLIPGVAIATALMPPLCTAGYGLATGQPHFFLGAFFLFTINGVFIALATLMITRVLRLPARAYPDEAARRGGRLWIAAVVTATLLPSIYLAVQLVRDEWFNTRAHRYLAALEASQKDVVILTRDIVPRQRRIEITLLGGGSEPDLDRSLQARLPEFGLAGAVLEIRQPSEGRARRDASALPTAAQQDLQRKTLLQLDEKTARVAALEQQVRQAGAEQALQAQLAQEIQAQWPGVRQVTVARATVGGADVRGLVVVLDAPRPMAAADVARLKRWLGVRLPGSSVEVILGKLAP
jgi:uncharacterized hydrophobic protein (TIGR00271 family)